jgi:Na+/melibiose symporter-like transporter
MQLHRRKMVAKRALSYNNILINAYWFGVSFMWNSLHPIVLPVLLLSFVNERSKNTVYGLLTFIGLLVAVITTPITGALSDETSHRLGRRRPWIVLGASLCVLFLLGLAWAPSIWAVAFGYLLLQVASNIAHGPAQGLIPDLVPAGERGSASGMKTLIEMLGTILAAIVMGILMDANLPRIPLAMVIIGGILLLAMGLTVAGVREASHPRDRRTTPSRSPLNVAIHTRRIFLVDWRHHKDYGRLLGARFLVLLSSFLVQSFALYYLRDVIEVDNPARAMASLMAVIAISITVIAYPAGVLSEYCGRRRLTLVACSLAAVGMVLLCVVRSMTGLLLLGGFVGIGMGTFASVNWAWATDLVPQAEAAKYLGLSNLATAGSAATARLGGPIIDLVNFWAPNAGYTVIFMLAALAALGGFWMTWNMSETLSVNISPGTALCAMRGSLRLRWRSER